MGRVVNKAELEKILGVSHTTLTEWQEQGMPIRTRGARGEENEYDCPTVIAWMVDREVNKRSRETQRDRLTRLQADAQELDLAERKRELVLASEIEPTWKHRVLSAAAYLAGQPSRLAGILEATPGVESKRKVLREQFAQFLTRLGMDGERMQDEVEGLLGRVSEAEAAAFLKRISTYDNFVAEPDAASPGGAPGAARTDEQGVAPVRPAEEDPPVGMG